MLVDSIIKNKTGSYYFHYSTIRNFYGKWETEHNNICYTGYQLNNKRDYIYKIFSYGSGDGSITFETINYLEQYLSTFEEILKEMTLIYDWLIEIENSLINKLLIDLAVPSEESRMDTKDLLVTAKEDIEIIELARISPEYSLLKKRLLLKSMDM